MDRTFNSWACSHNCEKRIIASSCPSVCPHGTTRLPLDELWWNLKSEYLSKICLQNFTFHYNRKTKTVLKHEDRYTYIISRSILLRIFANLGTRPRKLGTTVLEMWHNPWSIIYTANFDKANFDCTQKRDFFQKAYGYWQSPLRIVTASSAENVS